MIRLDPWTGSRPACGRPGETSESRSRSRGRNERSPAYIATTCSHVQRGDHEIGIVAAHRTAQQTAEQQIHDGGYKVPSRLTRRGMLVAAFVFFFVLLISGELMTDDVSVAQAALFYTAIAVPGSLLVFWVATRSRR